MTHTQKTTTPKQKGNKMGLTVGTTETNKKRTLVPEGNHVARCISIIDLGTADSEWKGEVKKRKRVMFTFEFPDHTAVFREEDGPQPLGRSVTYTASLSQKAKLRQDLQAWRGRAFTAEDLMKFDLQNVLGVPCLANVQHKENANGTTSDRIVGLSALPKGLQCPDSANEPWAYSIDQHPKNWDKVPSWAKEDILASDDMAVSEVTDTPKQSTEVTVDEVPF